MHERADRLVGGFVGVDHDLEREFEARLVESSTLAFRVAYSVLRHRRGCRGRRAGRLREGLSKLPAASRSGTVPRLARADDLAARYRSLPRFTPASDGRIGRQRPQRADDGGNRGGTRPRGLALAGDRRASREAPACHRAGEHRRARREGSRVAAGTAEGHRQVAVVRRPSTFEGAVAMDAQRAARANRFGALTARSRRRWPWSRRRSLSRACACGSPASRSRRDGDIRGRSRRRARWRWPSRVPWPCCR